MKIATLRTNGGTQAAALDGGQLIPLDFTDAGQWLQAGAPDWRTHVAGEPQPEASADIAPLLPAAGKIICVGLNYREHILEMGRELPQYPTLFAKFADSLVGAHDDIVLPQGSENVDWEAELTIVIGSTVSRADETAARKAIAGFTVSNDVSARDFQRRTPEWLQGKTFDKTTPLGPYLVTVEETGPEPDLEITCTVDGNTKQHSRTSELVFGPAALISYISAITTLRPGDVILTGTPGGVGDGRNPKEFLVPGSLLETSINTLGQTSNHCVVY